MQQSEELDRKRAAITKNMSGSKGGKALQAMEDTFKKFDQDGSMSLNFEEAKEFFKTHFDTDQSDEQLRANFDKIDQNGNGTIEKYELIEFLKKANAQN